MDPMRFQILLTMIAMAIAVVSVRAVKTGADRLVGALGFLCVAILVGLVIWSMLSG